MSQKESNPQERNRRQRQLRLRAQLLAKKSGARTDPVTELRAGGGKTEREQRRADISGGFRVGERRREEKIPEPTELQMRAIDPQSPRGQAMAAAGDRAQSGFTDSQELGQALIHAGLAAMGTMGGGMAAEGLMSKKLGIPLARSLGEGFGAGGTALARQQALDPGSAPNFGEALVEGGVAGGAGLLTSGAALAGADVGKIAPVFVDDIARRTRTPGALFGKQRGFRSTFGTQDPSLPAEVIAGKSAEVARGVTRVNGIMPRIRRKISPERTKKTELLGQAARDGVRIDPTEMIEVLEDSKIGTKGVGALSAEFDKFNSAVDFAIAKLKRARNRGGLTPIEMDELIRKQLRQKAFENTGEPSSNLIGQAFGDLNNVAQDLLSDALPEGVRDLNAAITARMEMMERAERMFGHGRSTEPGVTETALANAFRQNNTQTAQMLNFIEEMAGAEEKGLARDMFELAKERAFSGDIREASEASGFFQNVFGRVARGITKTASPIQSQVGPGTAAYRAFNDAIAGSHFEADRNFEIQRLRDKQRKLEARRLADGAGP